MSTGAVGEKAQPRLHIHKIKICSTEGTETRDTHTHTHTIPCCVWWWSHISQSWWSLLLPIRMNRIDMYRQILHVWNAMLNLVITRADLADYPDQTCFTSNQRSNTFSVQKISNKRKSTLKPKAQPGMHKTEPCTKKEIIFSLQAAHYL